MFRKILALLARFLLSLRYKVELKGIECLKGKKGALVLPNHPAEIDPVILTAAAWRYIELRPLVLEKYYFLKWIHIAMKLVRAIPVPDMDTEPGPNKRRRVLRAMEQTINAIKAGENILLYPSGSVTKNGRERLGGSSGVYTILESEPNVPIILVRTRGLYGSIFSKALTGGASPDFLATLWQGFKVLLSNLVIFVPRREVRLEFEELPDDFPRKGSLVDQNRWLEQWYDKDGAEQISLVSRKFWKEDLPEIPKVKIPEVNLSEVDQNIIDEVVKKIAELSRNLVENIHLESRLGDDIGLDSLDAAELLTWLDERFAINDVEMTEVATVASVARIASGHISKRQTFDTFIVPQQWFEDLAKRPVPCVTEAVSIQEAFLKVAERMGDFVAVADERSGVLSWKRTKLAVLLLANEIRKVPDTHIGVLLPASVGASLVIMAVLFCGKVPVMLNWTAGRRNVEHAIKTCKLSHIISSEAFVDLIDTDLEYIENKLLLVEKLKANIGLFSKLRALFLASKKVQTILSHLDLDKVKQEDHAVVLFTSGSEADPKGVPLSHRNILSNVDGGFSHFHFDVKDVMYGFLPPFHSFGLTVCCFLPLTTGLRVVYHPNPNESRKLASGCEKWGITIMAGTPTFLRGVLRAGEKEQFVSLRILVAGAEKAPDSLFELVDAMTNNAQLVEGYGITECSPVVCGNRPYQPHDGIGYPLKDVEMMIVHHETFEPLPEGERGLILIRGENVFSGYIGNAKSPFVEVNGKQWYNSGDLGFIENGAFHIAGRLKRFVKIGGEMLSLTAVEEVLSNEWPGTIEEGPVLAVTSIEKEDGSRPELHLFAKKEIEVEKANAVLGKAGFPNLVKISRVHHLNEIPILGSGKIDIQALNRLIKEPN